MAWTAGLWPVDQDTTTVLTAANELRTELNARAGLAVAAFVQGDSTWDAIKVLRDAVDGVITDFYKEDDWGQYVGNGVAGDGGGLDGTVNIFNDVFGGVRAAWRNTAAGGEATAPLYDPPNHSDPYTFHFNELHDVIDALEWKRAECSAYSDTNSKSALLREGGQDWGEPAYATVQEALDAAWTEVNADTAAAVSIGATMTAAYENWVGA